MATEFKPDFHGKRIWMYWPDKRACQFKENVEKGFMACEPKGGHDIGDINMIGERRIKTAIEAEYGYVNGNAAKLMSAIYKDVKIGDYVLARNEWDTFVGLGIVTGGYYYDESRLNFKHCRKVKWIDTNKYPYPDVFKSTKWNRVTLIDMPFRKIAEQIITALCEGKDECM